MARLCTSRVMLTSIFSLTACWCAYMVWLSQSLGMDRHLASHQRLARHLRFKGADGSSGSSGGGIGSSAKTVSGSSGSPKPDEGAYYPWVEDYRYERISRLESGWRGGGKSGSGSDYAHAMERLGGGGGGWLPRPPSPPHPPPESGELPVWVHGDSEGVACIQAHGCLWLLQGRMQLRLMEGA